MKNKMIKGAEIAIKCLENAGVKTLFAYPGGASMELHQALIKSTIRTILPRNEQGGAFAAAGFARATGKTGVCMATSGPGATNLLTGIADAYMDSIPMVAITGQVPSSLIGKTAFQDVVNSTCKQLNLPATALSSSIMLWFAWMEFLVQIPGITAFAPPEYPAK